jgi:hypothetical protein
VIRINILWIAGLLVLVGLVALFAFHARAKANGHTAVNTAQVNRANTTAIDTTTSTAQTPTSGGSNSSTATIMPAQVKGNITTCNGKQVAPTATGCTKNGGVIFSNKPQFLTSGEQAPGKPAGGLLVGG